MDLQKLNAKKQLANVGAVMTVMHPTQDTPLVDEETKQPITITLLGVDGDEYKKLQHLTQNKRIQKSVKKKSLSITAEEIDADSIELLARMTKSWTGVQLGDDKLVCNYENAIRLYSEVPFIREQAEAFIEDRKNFLGNA